MKRGKGTLGLLMFVSWLSFAPPSGASWVRVAEVEPGVVANFPTMGNGHLGETVALSKNGKRLVLGGPGIAVSGRWDGTSVHLRPELLEGTGMFAWAAGATPRLVQLGEPDADGGKGAVRIYELPDLTTPVATIEGRGKEFGMSLAASGRTAIVGAPETDGGHGRAFAISEGSAGWGIKRALPRGGSTDAYSEFGESVAIDVYDGAFYAAATCRTCQATGPVYGQVFVYRKNKAKAKFRIDDIVSSGGHPTEIALSDLNLAVYRSSDATIRIYWRLGSGDTGNWVGYAEIELAVDPTEDVSLAMSGDRLAVGMPLQRKVLLYTKGSTSTTWNLEQTLSKTVDRFGSDVALTDDLLLVGAAGFDYVDGVLSTGAAYLYEKEEE